MELLHQTILEMKICKLNFFFECNTILKWNIILKLLYKGKPIIQCDFFLCSSCVVVGNSFYFALLLPVALILLVNFVVLVMVMRSLTKKNNASSQRQAGKMQARITFACTTLLGLTWVLWLLAIGELTYTFQLLFTIFNSLQGFFIFVFYTLMNKDVSKEWKKFFKIGPQSDLSKRNSKFKMTSVKNKRNSEKGEL